MPIDYQNNEFLKDYETRIEPIIDECNKLLDGIENLDRDAKNEKETNRRKLNKWWDQDLKVLHLKQCHAYNLYALTDFKGETEKVS